MLRSKLWQNQSLWY